MNIELLKQLFVVAIVLSVVTLALIQKTKGMFKSSKYLGLYSFVVNIIFSVLFCLSFTDVSILNSFWVGLFGFLGADTLYKSLEGKLKSFADIVVEKPKEEDKPSIEIPR